MAPQAQAANPAAAQIYFVPFPEDDLRTALRVISDNNTPAYPMQSYFYISSIANDNIIYYDHWEDGYETVISQPTQSTTEIWSDLNPSNGFPPGFCTGASDPNMSCDSINTGTLIKLSNAVNATDLTNPTTPYKYNARDKYDLLLKLKNLEAAKIFDPDRDQSGMIVYTLNRIPLAGAWGQDLTKSVGWALPNLHYCWAAPSLRHHHR